MAKKKIKVYRYEIESNTGVVGPYNARHRNIDKLTEDDWDELHRICNRMAYKHGESDAHPSIRYDAKGFREGTHLCACDSIKSLKNWFKGFNEGLLRVGFNLVEYEVSGISKSESNLQVAFAKTKVISKKIIK